MDEEKLQELKNDMYEISEYSYEKQAKLMRKDFQELIAAIEELQAEKESIKSQVWEMVDLEEGNMVVFVGVHAVSWRQECGPLQRLGPICLTRRSPQFGVWRNRHSSVWPRLCPMDAD